MRDREHLEQRLPRRAWVRLDRLARITKTGDIVVLADDHQTSSRGSVHHRPGALPLPRVAEGWQLHEALRDGIRTGTQHRRVEVDAAATEAFALESSSASEQPGDTDDPVTARVPTFLRTSTARARPLRQGSTTARSAGKERVEPEHRSA
ncbi:hypothetical protein GCM10009854_18010 [Saccharopolyspora halophila]|uniref:Uncharacterized protein n=1 Tax=Saccharopolyspora halophila TaxID=405551 RepID=A0ABN3G0V9_9PSEU